MEEDMPVGFRFYPTEEELVSFYLGNKLRGERPDIDLVIPVVNIYLHRPWDLPQLAGVASYGDDEQWFYFMPGPENMARGGKPNRLTTEGYWKATGTPLLVFSLNNHRVIGEKRTMVFYTGRAPNGTKTEWKINEYKAVHGEASASAPLSDLELRQEFSLCRLYKKPKCDRAFDRRPLGVTAVRRRIAQQLPLPPPQDSVQTAAMILPQQDNNPPANEITGAGNSSPAGDAVVPSNNAMGTQVFWDNFTPIWDWEDCFNLL